jgi:hypothetical protein
LNLLELAKVDPDNWIRTLAQMYSRYPANNSIKCSIDDEDKQFSDTVVEFQKIRRLSVH